MWLGIVLCVSWLATVAIIAPWHSAMLDVCDLTHESPNTPHGWTVACAAMASSLGIARWLRSRSLTILAYGSLIPQWIVWYWLLLAPLSSCS